MDSARLPSLVALLAIAAAAALRAIPVHGGPATPDVALGGVRLLAPIRPGAAATLVWMRAVDRYAAGEVDRDAIAADLRAIGRLDPAWEVPWFFGVLMLPADAGDLRTELLAEAAALHPDVPWFAWRRGMDLLAEDRAAALPWLRRAASAPGADPAYAELTRALEAAP